jgi:mRNA-degrading endonuclease RelE of RelBE toxin-antitoxin system
LTGLRLRCGDYRVFFDLNKNGNSVEITAVHQRKAAYR